MEELNKFIRDNFKSIDKDMIRIQKEIDALKDEHGREKNEKTKQLKESY